MTVNRSKWRRKKWDEKLFQRIIARIRKGALTCDAIHREGISHQTFYSNLTPENLDALKAAQLEGPVHVAEQHLYKRGTKGYLKPVFQGGREVGRIREFSDACLIVYLKGNHPEKYRESAQTAVINSVSVSAPQITQALNEPTELERAALAFFDVQRKPAELPAVSTATSAGNTFPVGEEPFCK